MSISSITDLHGECKNKWIAVRYDVKHNREVNVGGVDIILQHEWTHKVAEDFTEQTKVAENTNYLESKPQICEVIIANPNYPYRVGDKLFVHYMAFESAEYGDIVTNEALIIADYVFFTILPNGEFKMSDGIYLGKQVYTEEQVSPSGIIFDLGQKKESLKVKITHIPKPGRVNVGDTVLSIDPYNYEFNYHPDRYIKLTEQEIAGVLV